MYTDVFIGVDFCFVELPDNFDCFGVINKYTFNCIIKMLSEFVIGQAGHPSCCLMSFFCIKTLLTKCFKLSLTGHKLLFQGSLFLRKGVFGEKILFRSQLPFTIVFIDRKLLTITGIILSFQQDELSFQTFTFALRRFSDGSGFDTDDFDLPFQCFKDDFFKCAFPPADVFTRAAIVIPMGRTGKYSSIRNSIYL